VDPFFASIWFAVVTGFGGAALLDAWSSYLARTDKDGAAGVLFYVSRGWGIVPILYALPELIRENGILGVFGVVPGWSLGLEAIARDFFGFSFIDILGLHSSLSDPFVGWPEVAWIVLGFVLLALISAISQAAKKHESD
jgi:hypothetical protein